MHQNYIKYKAETPTKYTTTSTGKERDSETGFSYFGARYYDSDILTGWLSVDPLADDFLYISPYNYCNWNPVKLKDPDGNIPLLANIAGAALGAAVEIAGQVVCNYFAKEPIGNINWTSVGISAVEGALTAGGSVVKQVAVTTAKNTFVKSASKATIKATAKREVFNKTVHGTASVAKAYFDDGPFVENLGYEAASAVLGSSATKYLGKIVKPKLLTNDGALQAARNKNGGHISGKEASKITEANRTNNQIKVNNNNRNIEKTSSFGVTMGTSIAKGLNKRYETNR